MQHHHPTPRPAASSDGEHEADHIVLLYSWCMTKLLTPFLATAVSSLVLTASVYRTSRAFAHGEDKPGPHGGYVQMPGAFHTELVLADSNRYEVYLLDMEFKNPTTENSSVKTTFTDAKNRVAEFTCEASGTKFVCAVPKHMTGKGFDLRKEAKAKISLTATRGSSRGHKMTYELPLKHKTTKEDHSGHGGHHH